MSSGLSLTRSLRYWITGITAVLVILSSWAIFSPRSIRSVDVIPELTLPHLHDASQFVTREDLLGHVLLVNFWASWCLPCREEHPLLLQLAESGSVSIIGVNYRDKREDALRWLSFYQNPYTLIGWDNEGEVSGKLGIDVIPVTLLVDRQGLIRLRHVGPMTDKTWKQSFQPILKMLEKEP